MNLLFVHGGPGYRDYLKPYFEGCLAKHYTYFYDQSQGDTDLDYLKDELKQKIKELSPVVLIGHSWGATLALECLRDKTPDVVGLVMLNGLVHHKHGNQDFIDNLEKKKIDINDFEKIMFSKQVDLETRNFIQKLNSTFDQKTFERIDREYLSKLDLTDIIKHISIPILNIFGLEDNRVPASSLEEISSLNSDIKTKVISKGSHFMFVFEDQRKEIISAIEAFVDGLSKA
ncbi:MAG: alpha/beta fold hydrolase [Bacteriovoracia bacterium]